MVHPTTHSPVMPFLFHFSSMTANRMQEVSYFTPEGINSVATTKEIAMPKKTYTKTKNSCRVMFELPTEVNAKKVTLLGDFNAWDPKTHPMKKRKDGSFYLITYLKPGEYKYRFLLDGKRWENDYHAEKYLPNIFGGEDSVISI